MKRQHELKFVNEDGDTNVYTVNEPTINDLLKIEALKIKLSGNRYKELILSNTASADISLDLIDMCSFFTILCPDLIKDSKIDLSGISISDALDKEKGIVKVFKEQFVPWWSDYQKIINASIKEDYYTEEEEEDEDE